MSEFAVPPDADLDGLFGGVRDEVSVDLFLKGDVWDLDLMGEEGDLAVSVDYSGLVEAEDVFGQEVGFGEHEGAEERVPCPFGLFEADAGDFFGSGVDLVVVVAVHFVFEHGAHFFRGGEFLEGAGSDDAVLQPAVGAFDLSFGLG